MGRTAGRRGSAGWRRTREQAATRAAATRMPTTPAAPSSTTAVRTAVASSAGVAGILPGRLSEWPGDRAQRRASRSCLSPPRAQGGRSNAHRRPTTSLRRSGRPTRRSTWLPTTLTSKAIEVAVPLTTTDSALRALLVTYALLVAGGMLLAGLIGAIVARSALAPIRRFTSQTEQVTSSLDQPAPAR